MEILWIKALHIISMVVWFSGLFYLPRLFVYHAMSRDAKMNERFMLMEKRLYYFVTWPGAILTILFGTALLYLNTGNALHTSWLQIKLGLVLLLLAYHFFLGHLLRSFLEGRNRHSAAFYRWLNELPTLFLISIVFLVVIKPRLF